MEGIPQINRLHNSTQNAVIHQKALIAPIIYDSI